MKKTSHLNIVILLTASIISIVVYQCKNPDIESGYYNPEPIATHSNGAHYVGSETCIECHEDVYKAHQETSHYKTSAISDENNILGSFEEGKNVLNLKYVRFTMEKKADSFYQLTKIKNRTKEQDSSQFDITIGSGTRGQTFATWREDELFQLQTSYYTATDSWVNSPGFPNYADSDRPIRDACLKCHVTFATNQDASGLGNRYFKEKIVFGIDCEQCHRPSKKHVVYHRRNPEIQAAQFMLSLDSLPRQHRLDVCAQCHSGTDNTTVNGNSFSFLSGQLLDAKKQRTSQSIQEQKLDVHGNQYGLLTQSKCFKQTPSMDCASCHNSHENQRGQTSYFNQKCIDCHSTNVVTCSNETNTIVGNDDNCIKCHMPITPSEAMKVQLNKTDSLQTSFYIRSHRIAIYAEK